MAGRLENTRVKVLVAARTLIVQGGFHSFSLDEVARAAGVTRVTVYNHFKTRAGLLEAVMDDIGTRADFQRLAVAFAAPDGITALELFMTEFVRAWNADEAMFRRVSGLSGLDSELEHALGQRKSRVRQAAARLAERWFEEGLVRDGWSRARVEATLYTLASFNTYDLLREGGLRSQREVVEALVALASTMLQPSRKKR